MFSERYSRIALAFAAANSVVVVVMLPQATPFLETTPTFFGGTNCSVPDWVMFGKGAINNTLLGHDMLFFFFFASPVRITVRLLRRPESR